MNEYSRTIRYFVSLDTRAAGLYYVAVTGVCLSRESIKTKRSNQSPYPTAPVTIKSMIDFSLPYQLLIERLIATASLPKCLYSGTFLFFIPIMRHKNVLSLVAAFAV